MSKIHHLPPHIIAKIAAGEVIERPAYAVKELIENAIDAGADEIHIFIEQAGLKKIQVTDNGEGMTKDDLVEAVKPHTTSKITMSEELVGIKTLGFRGEALASLASVSNLTIKSRTQNDSSGFQIDISNDGKIYLYPVGTPFGTTVIAENLFASVPARRKFLKSPQTEFRHIMEIVGNFALSYPTIHFILKHNNKTIFDFFKNQFLEERLKKIFGEEIVLHFIPVKNEDSYYKIIGFIAKPQVHTSSQSKQYIFVNNRKITDKLISLAVKESFGTMLEPTTFPIFVLFIDIPAEMIDINVHPRKEKVAFINQKSIFEIIKQTITETLQENNITFQNLSWQRNGVGTTNSFAANLLRETVLDKNSLVIKKDYPLIQLHNLYIISETKNGFLIFDQHAAHERVLFEKLVKEFAKQTKKQKKFKLKSPITLHISIPEQNLLYEYQNTFKKLGFVFLKESEKSHSKLAIPDLVGDPDSPLLASIRQGGNGNDKRVTLTHVPFLFQDRNPQEFVKEILEDLEQGQPIQTIDDISREMLSFLACHAAVKSGEVLTKNQMRKIIVELEKTSNNATCPHGRPTKMYFEKKGIDAMFKR